MPIGDDWASRNIRFKLTNTSLEILHVQKVPGAPAAADAPAADNVLLAGTFPKKLKCPDEVIWEIEENEKEGRHIAVQMAKVEAIAMEREKWPCLIEGDVHPQIDVRLVEYPSVLSEGSKKSLRRAGWMKSE